MVALLPPPPGNHWSCPWKVPKLISGEEHCCCKSAAPENGLAFPGRPPRRHGHQSPHLIRVRERSAARKSAVRRAPGRICPFPLLPDEDIHASIRRCPSAAAPPPADNCPGNGSAEARQHSLTLFVCGADKMPVLVRKASTPYSPGDFLQIMQTYGNSLADLVRPTVWSPPPASPQPDPGSLCGGDIHSPL